MVTRRGLILGLVGLPAVGVAAIAGTLASGDLRMGQDVTLRWPMTDRYLQGRIVGFNGDTMVIVSLDGTWHPIAVAVHRRYVTGGGQTWLRAPQSHSA